MYINIIKFQIDVRMLKKHVYIHDDLMTNSCPVMLTAYICPVDRNHFSIGFIAIKFMK